MTHHPHRRVSVVVLALAVLLAGLTPVFASETRSRTSSKAPLDVAPATERANTRLVAKADASIDRGRRNRNTGARRALRVRRNPTVVTLVKFKVPAGVGDVSAAKLRLRVKSPGAARVIVSRAGNRWNEGKVTWAKRPGIGDTIAKRNIPAGDHRWITIRLGDHVRGPGVYTLALKTLKGDRIVAASSESAHTPALIVTPRNQPPPPPPPSGGRVRLAAGGDFGVTEATEATMAAIGASPAQFLLALGDLSYDDATEIEWCNFVKGHLGENFPVEIVVGNHEDDDRPDGVFIDDFADCLRDRMGAVGEYGTEYYFDVDKLARFIMIGADNDVNGEKYDYEVGTSHYNWLRRAINDAREEGIQWVIVGMHKVCITAGNKPCEVGSDLYDLLLSKRVDLILHGHDHDYQRSKQLTCATPEQYRPGCVADDGSDDRYAKGAGSVFAIIGNTGGGGLTDIDEDDPDFDYLAEWHGSNSPDPGRGYLAIDITSDRMVFEFVGTTTSYRDRVVIG